MPGRRATRPPSAEEPPRPGKTGTCEKNLNRLLSHLTDVIVSYDRGLRYTFINKPGAVLLGLGVEDVIGRTNREILGPGAETVEPHLRRALNERAQVSVVHHIPLPDGTRSFDTVYAPILDDTGEVERLVGICRDVTSRVRGEREREREQKEHQASRRTEAVTTLAGGMAHRFNNTLSAVMGNLDLLDMDLAGLGAEDRAAFAGYIEGMRESLEHMGRLTSQLLAYAQGGRYTPTVIPVGTFVRYLLPVLAHQVGKAVRMNADLPEDLWSVEADTAQLQMLLSAVVQNASEAMEGGGTIRISARNVRIDDQDAGGPGRLQAGSYVRLDVEDDGAGMDEDTLERIFDPFFSTKLQGRGLGLAAAYGIVRNHGGGITARSAPGEGTRLSIWLPVREAAPAQEGPTAEAPRAGGATVLVVEDEAAVLGVFRMVFERMGYRVLAATTGGQAVETVEGFPERIDLVILDILLPDTDGRRVYPELIQRRPDLKVIVTSGYSVEGPAREVLDAGAQAFLPKPFSLPELRETITRVMGDAPSLSGRS
jgi:PAS domain S-box-containing protein